MAAALSAKSVQCAKLTQVRASRPRAAVRTTRSVKVCAKYGEQSRYFDLNDLENSTGSWELYGTEDDKRYPGLQVTFFKRAGDAISRRDALRGFIALGGIGGILTWGYKGSKDAQLPITKGPQTSGENGKGGSVRSRL